MLLDVLPPITAGLYLEQYNSSAEVRKQLDLLGMRRKKGENQSALLMQTSRIKQYTPPYDLGVPYTLSIS